MKWLAWHTLEIGDSRVVDVDRVRALGDAGRLERALHDELSNARRRLARRFRAYRRAAYARGLAAGQRDGLGHVARVFALERQRWEDVEARLGRAIEDALRKVAPALPPALFVEAALRKMAEHRGNGDTWVIHVNRYGLHGSLAWLEDTKCAQGANVRVTHAAYLTEGVCVVETAGGVIELRGDLERNLVLDTIRETALAHATHATP